MLSKGDLVFDVGANIGEYCEIFVELGARVVAIEPNPALAAKLRQLRPFSRIFVEEAAVGASEGAADLYLSNHDALSSLSTEWISMANQTPRLAAVGWKSTVQVRVTTLDALAKVYGRPKFIKVDVEGFEKEALAGLTVAPSILSFEFISEFSKKIDECLQQKCFDGSFEFNIAWERSTKLSLETWVSKTDILSIVSKPDFARRETYGDIYARPKAR